MFVTVETADADKKLIDLEGKLESYYSASDSVEYFKCAQDSNNEWSKSAPHNIIFSLVKSGTSILDMGCGTGVVAQHLREYQVKYTGVDWSTTALELAGKRISSKSQPTKIKADFYCRSIYETGFENETFDLVVSFFVIEHLTRPRRFLQEAMRLVKPGGYLFILCPDYRRFGRMPSLPFGGAGSLKDKIRSRNAGKVLLHLIWGAYWKARTAALGSWAVWDEPECFNGHWRPDADAVYLASRKEISNELGSMYFEDVTSSWIKMAGIKLNKIDSLIIAQRSLDF